MPVKPDDASTPSTATPTTPPDAPVAAVAPQTPATPAGVQTSTEPEPTVPSTEVAPPQDEQQSTFAPDPTDQDYGFVPSDESPEVADVTWTASEFIAHEKSPLWYFSLMGITIVVVAVVYFVLHDFVAIAALIFVAILFGFLAAHKPRVLSYHITPAGLTIDRKTYAFSDFKSYGVINEGAFSSITFIPLKRFMPTLSIYYPPEQEAAIVNALSNYLPFAPATHDLIDRLMHRIRL
ncbi:MAG: hypothetical protein ACQR33_03915 [Candidatus Saccharibacteria bacterium]